MKTLRLGKINIINPDLHRKMHHDFIPHSHYQSRVDEIPFHVFPPKKSRFRSVFRKISIFGGILRGNFHIN
jgi:hypothetical protein